VKSGFQAGECWGGGAEDMGLSRRERRVRCDERRKKKTAAADGEN
jgi:hypothetical protein